MRTSPARQQERAKPCHPVDAGLAVARRRVATRLSNRTVVTLGTGHCQRRCLFGILGSRPVFALMMGGLSSASPLTVARRARSQIWTGAMISVFRHITVSISMTALFCVREACNKNHMPNYEQGGHQAS